MGEHDDLNKLVMFIQWIQHIHAAVQDQLEKSQAKYIIRHDKHQVNHQLQHPHHEHLSNNILAKDVKKQQQQQKT